MESDNRYCRDKPAALQAEQAEQAARDEHCRRGIEQREDLYVFNRTGVEPLTAEKGLQLQPRRAEDVVQRRVVVLVHARSIVTLGSERLL